MTQHAWGVDFHGALDGVTAPDGGPLEHGVVRGLVEALEAAAYRLTWDSGPTKGIVDRALAKVRVVAHGKDSSDLMFPDLGRSEVGSNVKLRFGTEEASHAACPNTGDCLVDPNTGHTEEF